MGGPCALDPGPFALIVLTTAIHTTTVVLLFGIEAKIRVTVLLPSTQTRDASPLVTPPAAANRAPACGRQCPATIFAPTVDPETIQQSRENGYGRN